MGPRLPVLFLPLLLLASPAAAQGEEAPLEVGLGLYIINIGNYDVIKGTYTVDFYLIMRWNVSEAGGVDPTKFEFMNGRSTSREKIFDNTTDGEREVWFRLQAALYSEPQFSDYPYDKQTLEILVEDTVSPRSALVYRPLVGVTELDDSARVPGWRTESWALTEGPKVYKFNETYSRARFHILVFREPLSSTIKSFLPPVAFMVVAGLGFFFHPSKTANRIALGTGMLIAAVAFHISQTSALPPIGSLIFFDRVMLTVYSFIAIVLAVATLIAIDEDYWKESDHTRSINAWGAVAAVVIPVLVFLGLTRL